MTETVPGRKATLTVASLTTVAALALAACTSDENTASTPATTPATAPASSAAVANTSGLAKLDEAARVTPRLVLSHAGGLTVVDAFSGETIKEEDRPGFLRLNDSGDGRTVLVTDGDEILGYDAAVQVMPHGDHNHYYAGANPQFTGGTFEVPTAGHVVHHHGRTALFSDGEGTAQIFDTADLLEADHNGVVPADEITTLDSGAPHHGVAVPLPDDTALITAGTTDERHTIRHVDEHGAVLAETMECPGVHGEAALASGEVVFGCEDGAIVFDGTQFHKVGTAHSGTLLASPASDVVLADAATDNEDEPTTAVALIDAHGLSTRTVDLGASYWFRSLGRGAAGEAIVLTTDGHLKVIDPETGEITKDIPAIGAWEENDEWQEPGPILTVDSSNGTTAYVSDPAAGEIVVIDVDSAEEVARFAVAEPVTEMVIANGKAEAGAATEDDHDHEHEGESAEHDHNHEGEAEDHDHDH